MPSGLAQYAINNFHTYKFDNREVLYTFNNHYKRLIFESFYIQA